MSARFDQLLREFADGLEEGRDKLLDTEWLAANEVTMGENHDIANQATIIIKGYLSLPSHIQNMVLIAGAASNLPNGKALAEAAVHVGTREHAMERLRKL